MTLNTSGYVYFNHTAGAKCTVKGCEFSVKGETYEDKVAGILPHLSAAHKVDVCRYCGTLIKRSYMSKHQKTDKCKCEYSSYLLRLKGLVKLKLRHDSHLHRYFLEKRRNLPPIINALDNAIVDLACENARQYLHNILGYELHNTDFRAGGWGRPNQIRPEGWVDADMLRLVHLQARRKGLNVENWDVNFWDDEMISLLVTFHENPELRDAIQGTLELSVEAL